MKVDRQKLKRQYMYTDTPVPFDISTLISKLRNAMKDEEVQTIITGVKQWPYKQSDLYHWIDVLDCFDLVLEEGAKTAVGQNPWQLAVDLDANAAKKQFLIDIIEFTTLLVKNSISSNVYNSFEHLTTLLNSADLCVVFSVLELLLALAKRGTHYIPANQQDRKPILLRNRVNYLAENWGGKDYGVSLAQCLQDMDNYPPSATTLHFEFYPTSTSSEKKVMRIENVHLIKKPLAQLMNDLVAEYKVPTDSQQQLYARLRLTTNFGNFEQRQLCVQARLCALAVNALSDSNFHVTPALVEETIEILALNDLYNVKAIALKSLRSFINYDRHSKLKVLVEATGANSYHGLIPKLTRSVINSMIDPTSNEQYPTSFTAALLSFLYHMGFYEAGRQALQQCGLIEQMLKFIQWEDNSLDNLFLIARAIRIIDSITSRDMGILQSHNGLNVLVKRLEREVDLCRIQNPYEIKVDLPVNESDSEQQPQPAGDGVESSEDNAMQVEEEEVGDAAGASKKDDTPTASTCSEPPAVKCYPQRCNLIKGMVNFLRKATQYSTLSESIRPLMTSTGFSRALKHLISNPAFYGGTVFAFSIDMVSLYIHHEPSLLTTIQNNGLAGVMLRALFDPERKLPLNKDFASAMPNVLTALCLNARGLRTFVEAKPFSKILSIFTNHEYLVNLQTNGSVTSGYDNTVQLGKAVDQLIRHQPSLRVPCLNTIVRTLEQLAKFGEDEQYMVQKETFVKNGHTLTYRPSESKKDPTDPREEIPLLDYITNIMRFMQTILNSTTQHGLEFMRQQGLHALLKLLTLPNLPADFGNSSACYYMSSSIWWLLKFTHDKNIFIGLLEKLKSILVGHLDPILADWFKDGAVEQVGASVLLSDLIRHAHPKEKWQETELWRAISMVFTHISVLLQICRPDHSEQLRTLSLEQWATPLGQELILSLSKVHVMLTWETVTMTLSLDESCAQLNESFPSLKGQIDAVREIAEGRAATSSSRTSNVGSTHETIGSPMEVDQQPELPASGSSTQTCTSSSSQPTQTGPTSAMLIKKLIDPIMTTSRNISRSIEDLFALMLKLCVANPAMFHRRSALANQQAVPTPNARILAKNLNSLPCISLKTSLQSSVPPKFRYHYYETFILHCSSMLFDMRNNPYQLILQNFVFSGAQDAFFELFEREITPTVTLYISTGCVNSLPSGFEHFLDTWLSLAERLSNLERISDTAHAIPSKNIDAILANSSYVGFEPMEYIIRTHRQMYQPVLTLWNSNELLSVFKTKQIRSTVLMLISELFRSAPLIEKYLVKREEATKAPSVVASNADALAQPQSSGNLALIAEALGRASALAGAVPPPPALPPSQPLAQTPAASGATSSAPAGAAPAVPVSQDAEHAAMLDMLVDMGFTRSIAADALIQNGYDVTAAADWLLNTPNAPASGGAPGAAANEFEMSDEDQVARAIAMSLEHLGDPDLASVDAPDEAAASARPAAASGRARVIEPHITTNSTTVLTPTGPVVISVYPPLQIVVPVVDLLVNEIPLDKPMFDSLLKTLIPGLLNLLDREPSNQDLNKCAELLNVIVKAGHTNMITNVASHVVLQIVTAGQRILSQVAFISEDAAKTGDLSSKLSPEPEAKELATRVQFLLLICNESKGACLKECVKLNLYQLAVELMDRAAKLLTMAEEHKQKVVTPKWLCPIAIWLDLYEKYAIGSKKRGELVARVHGRTWKAFQDRNARWNSYDSANNRLIDDAYRAGETSVRITVDGNRKYTIRFDTMMQHGESTGSQRPVMFIMKDPKEPRKSKTPTPSVDSKASSSSTADGAGKSTAEPEVESYLPRLGKDMIRSIVSLIKLSALEAASLNAIVRLVIRITMLDHSAACDFAEQSGIGALLKLTSKSSFTGSTATTQLIIRHVFEDAAQLSDAMEREVRRVATPSSATLSANQEMYNVLRNLAPVAARDPVLFKDIIKKTLKVNITNKTWNEAHEDRMPTYLEPIKVTTEPAEVELPATAKAVITELLNVLPARLLEEQKKDAEKKQSSKKKEEEVGRLFGTSTVLSILSELIKSYQSVAKVVCDHSYARGFADLITEDCSALSFILDNLLNNTDTPSYPKTIFASLASMASPNLTTIHQVIVTEVKAALHRAVNGEGNAANRHNRVEAIATLVLLVIESCPKTWSELSQPPPRPRQQYNANQLAIIRMMVKCGLVNDLARSTQALDLSSPKAIKAVDALTRTLEVISETMTYVPKPTSRNTATGAGANGGASTRQSANSQALDAAQAENNQVGGEEVPPEANPPAAEVQIHAMEEDDDHFIGNLVHPAALSPRPHIARGNDVDDVYLLRRIRRARREEDMDASVADDDEELSEAASILEEMSRHNDTLDDDEDRDDDEEQEEDEEDDDDEDEDEHHHRHHIMERFEDDEDGEAEGDEEDEEEADEEEEYEDEDDEDFDAIPMPPPDLLEDIRDMEHPELSMNGGFSNRDFAIPLGGGPSRDAVAPHLIRLAPPMADILMPHPMLLSSQTMPPQPAPRTYSANEVPPARLEEVLLHPRSNGSRRNGGVVRLGGDGGTYRFSITRDRSSATSIRDELGTILQRIRGPNAPTITQHMLTQFTSQISNFLDGTYDWSRQDPTGAGPIGSFFISNSAAHSTAASNYGAPTNNTTRWDDECRLMMGEFFFDTLMGVQNDIVSHLERGKSSELGEIKKKKEEEAKTKIKEAALAKAEAKAREETTEDVPMSTAGTEFQPAAPSAVVPIQEQLDTDQPMNEVSTPPRGSTQENVSTQPEAALSASHTMTATSQQPPQPSTAPTVENVDQPMNDASPPRVAEPQSGNTATSQTPVSIPASSPSESVPMEESTSAPAALPAGSSSQSTVSAAEEPIAGSSGTASTTAASQPELTPELRAILGDIQIPEGIDPSYLAALPEDIRQEVIAEQLRIQRLAQQQTTTTPAPASTGNSQQANASATAAAASVAAAATAAVAAGTSDNATIAAALGAASHEISPEFLAALPPDIRQEVLAQQRAEQLGVPNPHAPLDPDNFIRTLPPSLRRQVLADMDDSQVQLLTGDLAQEARTLRREHVIRREHAFMEEYMVEVGRGARGAAAIAGLNAAIGAGRLGRNIRAVATMPPMILPMERGGYRAINAGLNNNAHRHNHNSTTANINAAHAALLGLSSNPATRALIKGKHLLDHDSLSSLLMLLFVSESVMNLTRLHRLIRNVCYHGPTRQWVIASLLEIVERAKLSAILQNLKENSDEDFAKFGIQNRSVSWLSISFESAFGAKTNVFQLDSTKAPSTPIAKDALNTAILIHPHAASFVCRKVLDILIYLAKSFPDDFVTVPTKESANVISTSTSESQETTTTTPSGTPMPSSCGSSSKKHHHHGHAYQQQGIFDALMLHDSIHGNKKAKGSSKHHGSNASLNLVDINDSPMSSKGPLAAAVPESPFSQLLNLLSQPFFVKSSSLTDRLIRLLTCSMANTGTTTLDVIVANAADGILNDSRVTSTCTKYASLEKALSNENLLQLLVTFLTSTTCSEDGLTDAHSLMIKLSTIFPNCREIFHRKLLEAAQELGTTVLRDIEVLINELGAVVTAPKKAEPLDLSMPSTSAGVVKDRYNQARAIVIAGNRNSKKGKTFSKEIHLPAMSTLISKTSSQYILLRILDIVAEIREQNLRDKIDKEKAKRAKASEGTAAAAEVVPEAEPLQELIAPNGSRSILVTQMDVDLALQLTADDTRLSEELSQLEPLWTKLSECLDLLEETSDENAVLVLEPSVEAFFLVHAADSTFSKVSSNGSRANQGTEAVDQADESFEGILDRSNAQQPPSAPISEDMDKFMTFAERHRVVINQILRQSNIHLTDGTFGFLIDHAKILDFDVKRRYFREELKRLDQGVLRRGLSLPVNRANVFEDSFRALDRLTAEEWKGLFRINFEGEEGQDAGGLLREWYTIIAREIFNPNYALFTHSPGDGVTYMINQSSFYNSNHLNYFRFVGRLIAKAIYENQLLDCYFTRSFYKHMLGKPVRYTDMEAEDNAFYQGLVFLQEHNVNELGTELTFSIEIQEFGITKVIDLKPDGRNIVVTEESKQEYVRLVCQEKMTGSIRQQLNSFLQGFHEIVPKRLISIFNEHELELLISGLPEVDVEDLAANTEYHKYAADSLQVQWFWRACRTFDQTDRAKLLQFVTGTSKVPLQGFAALGGGNEGLKFKIYRDDRSTDRLPCAHTCFNQLDLPAYETYEKLRTMLLKAIHECSEGFGFA